MAEESFLTAEQLADRLNITKTTVYRLVRRGDLRGYLVGRALRFDPDDVRAYLARVQTDGQTDRERAAGEEVPA